MSKAILITVIPKCKGCNDEGVKITNDTLVKCYDCNKIKDNHDVQSWFEIKENKTIGVRAGIHLTAYPGKPWEEVK